MNAGYKGIVHNHPGYVSCPNNPFKPVQWQDKLQELQLKYASWTQLGKNKTGDGLSDVTELMKERYPGNYCVIEKYDSITGKFVLKLEFTDPKEEIFWLLKWS